MSAQRQRGFTLIEVMSTVAIIGVLTAVALPSYTAYVARSRVPVGLDALSALATRLEQYYQDVGNYGAASCGQGMAMPVANNYTVTCALSGGGTGFTATATGSGSLAGYTYTINHQGTRRTTAHPKGVPAVNCWSTKGGICDA